MSDFLVLERKSRSASLARRSLLTVNAIAYVGGMGTTALYFTGKVSSDLNVIMLVSSLCWLVWFVSLIGSIWLILLLNKSKDIKDLIDDERTVNYVHLCFRVGYLALLIVIAAFFALSFFIKIELKFALAILLAVGVGVTPLTYAFSYRA